MSTVESESPEDQSGEPSDVSIEDQFGLKPSEIFELHPDDIFHRVLLCARSLNSTDLFFLSNEHHYQISVRRMGSIEQVLALPNDMGVLLVNYVRSQSGMDISKKQEPTDGRWLYEQDGTSYDLRVNSVGTLWGEDVAIRLSPKQADAKKLDELGFVGNQKAKVSRMVASSGGLILVSGPTGSGKTTSLYALLDLVNDGTKKINTLEDPIEYSVPGLCQSQVNEKRGLSFSTLLRGILRQSPDVIMIGEIRDEETANIAVRAANSGHLVLTTVHSPTAVTAISSLNAMKVNSVFLASSLIGIVSQRLIRLLSEESKIKFEASEALAAFDDVSSYLTEDEGLALYGPDKTDKNSQGGYSQLSGLFEVLSVGSEMKKAIAAGASEEELTRLAKADGMLSFQDAGLIKVAKGTTSLEEVMRVLPQFD